MIQRAKKEVFCHFFQFGTSDELDIVYYDSTKCFPAFDNIIQKSQKAFLNDPKWQKRGFGHFLDFGLLDRLDIA